MPFPLDEKYILEAENELGVEFPDSYKEKMLIENGGELDVEFDCFDLFPFWDKSDKKRLARTCNSVVRETLNERTHYRFPENLIAIGNNGGGDLLVFKIESNGKLENTLFWLDHENEELNFIANDFREVWMNE